MASQITSLTIVYSSVYSDAYQSTHQSSASLAFVWGIHRWPVNSPHKWPVTREMFPFDDVIMSHSHIRFLYIPWIMHTTRALLCLLSFSVGQFYPYSSLALGRWRNRNSASEVTLNMDEWMNEVGPAESLQKRFALTDSHNGRRQIHDHKIIEGGGGS